MTGVPARHEMPFGALPSLEGGVDFRLWAPGQETVSLVLEEAGEALAMARDDDGFFALRTDRARPGSRYRFRLEDGTQVPDPASRFQPADVHGPSEVIDPVAYAWRMPEWTGRPFADAVLYELHLGTFSPSGDYDGLREKLDHLAELGVTAVELMPLADFSGSRNWGYDGVLPFAPDSAYGRPEDLKALIDACHERGLMAFLDVVYNHFGPDGNYLGLYAGDTFNAEIHTPWGPAIDYSRRPVRDFALHNVLYWLEEYRFDGLRFDAVDQIRDESARHLLVEIAETAREKFRGEREVHLVLENDANLARLLPRDEDGRPRLYSAQWNDDWHHVAQHLLAGDTGGYYADYTDEPVRKLAEALATGFVYQGQASAYRGGVARGEASAGLPPLAFVNFTQNHDQIGNRAFGDRLTTLAPIERRQALTAILLLAPQIPLLFMGEEWASEVPFRFFTDFHDDLADAVREGRRREFQRFPEFADPVARERIPDPNDQATFLASKLDWEALDEPAHAAWLDFVRTLLHLRAERVVPLLAAIGGDAGSATMLGARGFRVDWRTGEDGALVLLANLGDGRLDLPPVEGALIYDSGNPAGDGDPSALDPWTVRWLRQGA
jgi:maltooligosyltrehalose trehalohydrolase